LQHNLARIYADQNRLAEAEALARDALAKRKRVIPLHEGVARTLLLLGGILVREGSLDEAEATIQEGLALLREKYAMKANLIAQAENELGAVHLAKRQYPEAGVLLTRAPESFLKPAVDLSPRERAVALQRLVAYYRAVENSEKAAERQKHLDRIGGEPSGQP
ncbi:MAG TPA: tetratricopeptide repeat protein, partial [Verrucomicrobiota bacterium]|nr:tetratricopeptide repeat protein [Verrucomicrobiota bacterium]